MVFLLISSKVFKFCSYHRLFIYYVLVDELLLLTDWYFKIPISNEAICHIHFGIAIVFLSLAIGIFIYKKFKGNIKICKDVKDYKESIS